MQLEICIDCVESALAAQHGGAHRIEICGSLASGGTTPSLGLVKQCIQRCQIPSVVMIRPHDGGFVYSEDDLCTMLHDIEVVKQLGVQGVVFGALTPDGNIDVGFMERLIKAARPLQVTFHRAFDVVGDPLNALDAIIELGIDRLLTSGQSATAEKGMPLVQQLVERAGDRLIVMAGAGINYSNVRKIMAETRVPEIHASASVLRSISLPKSPGVSTHEVSFGDGSRVTSTDQVRKLIQIVSPSNHAR